MNNVKEVLARRQAELEERLERSYYPKNKGRMLGRTGVAYEVSKRARAIDAGGLGLIQEMVGRLGLAKAIDSRVELLKRHHPYHESDHVLNLVYNVVTGGQCLEDLERRRNDVGYLDAVGARRIPDPTTAGDFLRRFTESSVESLLEAIQEVRGRVWRSQPKEEREVALIDVDGTIAETTGWCKEGADVAYTGQWGFGPLVISLGNTQEVLSIVNRPASRPSQEGAVSRMDQAASDAKSCGFERVRFRGDTAFTMTAHLDRWNDEGHEFVFGMMAHQKVVDLANGLNKRRWRRLRRAENESASKPRQRPIKTKQELVEEKGFKVYHLESEHVAELEYRPRKARRAYRLVVLRKSISVHEGQIQLIPQTRYFFYLTNIDKNKMSAAEVVFQSNARCHQENLIEQLKNQVGAMRMPAREFVANWAYLVIGSLAWNLKLWLGLLLPNRERGREIVRMEFRGFLRSLIYIPAQIVNTGRRLVYRFLAFNRWIETILETHQWLRQTRLC